MSSIKLYRRRLRTVKAPARTHSPHRGTSLHEVTRMDLSSASIALRLLAVFALVAANGLFVAAEFSIVKARRTRIAQLVRAGRRGARLVQRATENPEPFVAATQLGITIASLGLGWIGEPFVAPLIEPLLGGLPLTFRPAAHRTISAPRP